MANGVAISAAVEGIVDEAVARTLILFSGAIPGPVYGKQGKPFLQQRIRGYNTAAHHAPWVVLVDLDRDHDCAPPLFAAWLPQVAPRLCFRVAMRAVEAWLLADPEALDNPKLTMVALARASRRRDIREDMVPREGSGRPVGPAYASRLIEFTSSSWRPQSAAQRANSLWRAIECLRRIAGSRDSS
jgi:hypothetical protein